MEREPKIFNSSITSQNLQFPAGFRFHPSDEELIVHYLRNKATSRPLPASVAAEINLYKYNPWDLPKKALFGEEEWYFFSPRDRKYPKGERPNRAAGLGYWKATGIDKPIFSSFGSKQIGVKKSLVFYVGRPPKGEKTGWYMNEYRLLDSSIKPTKLKGSMRLDDWVLCRVRCKGYMAKKTGEIQDSQSTELIRCLPNTEEEKFTSVNHDLMSDYMSKDSALLAWILSGQSVPPIGTNIPTVNFEASENSNSLNSLNYVNSCLLSPTDNNFSIMNGKTSKVQGYIDGKKKFAESDVYGYFQNQSQYHILNPNYPMDSIDKFQELNEPALTSRYLS